MIREIAAHEVGHMFNVPNERAIDDHCIDSCLMGQGSAISIWAEDIQRKVTKIPKKFCLDCQNDFQNLPRLI